MKFVAIKRFSSVRYGNVKVGDPVPVTGDIAKQMVDQGMIKLSESYAQELRQKEAAEKAAAEQKAKLNKKR